MLKVLKKRCDFLSIAKHGVFVKGRGCLIQVCRIEGRCLGGPVVQETDEGRTKMNPFSLPFFWGVTASKKVGNSVLRNKAKRRLRAWARENLENVLKQRLTPLPNLQAQIDSKDCISLSKRTVGLSVESQVLKDASWPSQGKEAPLSKKVSDPKMLYSLAVVFIATKTTASLRWEFLRKEIEKTLLTGLTQLNASASS